ncbi:MAG: dUTP diphosphatase [Acidimicrobiia bacterium]|nr:dUTP diphosphatase [Acidimicrobiia bacterium]
MSDILLTTTETTITIPVRKLNESVNLPKAQNRGDAGYDLQSAADLIIKPGERALVPTGIAIAIPIGYAGFVQPRSGLAIKNGIGVLNSPGLIDSGYRDELKVILINTDQSNTFEIKKGDRIAQLVIQKYESVNWNVVDDLEDSDRGTGGFGSTGV